MVSFLVSGTIFFAFVGNWSVSDAFYISVTMLPPVGFGAPDSPPPPTASDLLAVAGILLISLVGSAVLLVVLHRIPLLLTENRLDRLGTFLRADWLRTAWIGLGVLFFVMVVVPGALLIYQYSSIGD